MTYFRSSRWRPLLTALFLTTVPTALLAQVPAVPSRNMAGPAISDHLNTLASSPKDLRALLGAGEAALQLDDPNAAIGFFGRAEEVDPRNPRAKAGLARALLMLEKPRDALRLFDQAVDYGMVETRIASDRGLAHDLRGDQRKAQRDYLLALRGGEDPETTRRYALSLAISGERDQALKLIEPLLYKQDKGAWRVRAFILALSGDTEGANGVARQLMPGNLARPMAPFFAKLPSLSAQQKAAAVHFGHIPSDGRSGGMLYARDNAAPAQNATKATRADTSSGRRSGNLANVTAAQRANARMAATETRATEARQAQTATATPAPVLQSDTRGVVMAPARTTSAPETSARLAAIVGGLESEKAGGASAESAAASSRAAAKPAPKPAATKTAEIKKAPAKKPAAKPDPKKTEPARIWAQVLTGQNKAALARDYGKLVKASPAAFKGKTAWTAAYRNSNRLLVGPFTSSKLARDFLDAAKVKGFVWSSAAGEPVEKMAIK